MDIAVVGAGISALAYGQVWRGKHQIQLYEATRKGGLIRCEVVQGHLYHLVGGHVFNAKNEQVLNWFWGHFDPKNEFVQTQRNAQIWLNGQLVGYPIENHLYQLPAALAQPVVEELLQRLRNPHPATNFREWCQLYPSYGHFLRGQMGEALYTLYFEPYNRKIWRCDPHELSLEWLEGKLPMLLPEQVVSSNILRAPEEEMVHARFFYPTRGGSQFIVERLAHGLAIRENSPIHSIRRVGKGLQLNDELLHQAVVYTGDVRRLPQLLQGAELQESIAPFVDSLAQLRANGTTNVLCTTDANNLSWLYLPGAESKAHRIIYTGNFSPNNQPSNERRSCTVEFSGWVSEEEARAEIAKLPGHLQPLSYHYQEASYVLQNTATRPLIAALKAALRPHGIYLLGRFAEWEYYNMDKCIEAAFLLSIDENVGV